MTWARQKSPKREETGSILGKRQDCPQTAWSATWYRVFAAPCRGALTGERYAEASAINRQKTGRGLSQQAFGIGWKIQQVDDAMTPERQEWAFEVHPEVCFWALNGERPKKVVGYFEIVLGQNRRST
jgi:predicted RNase H-like nuclease